ncbi:MAG: FAD-dependent oxidoreductase [Legionellaceae bacterium]|nr:FAD-dependent oxidoreductase [Legionellaceae bacterium]
MFDVIIIGAGLSGTLTSLNLAKHSKVLLIETGDSVIPTISSSYNECYKLHTGVHYVGDLLTAKHCLEKSIQFARQFPEYILGGDELLTPWRRGRHYFMSNSLVSTDSSLEVATQLQERYRDLVSLDHGNKVFGEPEDFISVLSQEDYPHMAKDIPFYNQHGREESTSIVLGVETAESQIDINKLKTDLQQKVLNNPNITFLCSTTAYKISSHNSKFGYLVSTRKDTGEISEYESKAIVNCAWQNIELLDRGAGVYVPDENRVIRVKVSILVQLPETLRRMNTFICSSGPYCSVTTLPNGTAILTSERITNVGFFKAGIVDEEILGFIKNELKLHTVKGNSIANNILSECAHILYQVYVMILSSLLFLSCTWGL